MRIAEKYFVAGMNADKIEHFVVLFPFLCFEIFHFYD